MKIALIGPGILPIPPIGWGAVEILIWDYSVVLKEQGHEVDIINPIRDKAYDQSSPYTEYCQSLIHTVNEGNYDFVHLHYDCMCHILPHLTAPKIGITSWYPYIDQVDKHRRDGYDKIFPFICQNRNHIIFTASKKDYEMYTRYCESKENVYVLLGGIPKHYTRLNREPKFADKSVYLGKIEPRKAQMKYMTVPNIDFYGPCDDGFFLSLECYKGELKRENLYETLSEYGNMILLSTGENGTPYVIKEALMVGLPIVTNEYSSNDLDRSMPFIDIIPTDKLDDLIYIEEVNERSIAKNYMKEDIIRYAHENFSLEIIVEGYIKFIESR